jgi:hypothetical protein
MSLITHFLPTVFVKEQDLPSTQPSTGAEDSAAMSSTWALVPPSRRHFRDESFHVRYSDSEVARLATEIHEQTIADVHLSLFTYWISEHKSHYEQARVHIRELGLDQVSQ